MAKKSSVIFLLIGVIAGTITFDNIKKDFFRESTIDSVTVEGSFTPRENSNIEVATTPFKQGEEVITVFEGAENIGSSELSLSDVDISEGELVIANSEHPIKATSKEGVVNLSTYKNDCYSVIGNSIRLKQSAADALNNMMSDYASATQLTNFAVYSTTEAHLESDSPCPREFHESIGGNCVDLAVIYNSKLVEYDGQDTEGWIVENCYKYGFIVRYPKDKEIITGEEYCAWHLRYVGEVHAKIMYDRNLCLEEYIETIKDFNYEQPLVYNLNGQIYRIYYINASDISSSRVPISGNYIISGNNIDGYIVTLTDY